MSYNFGSGNLYASALVNGTPNSLKFGVLQEFMVDFSFTLKELYGQNQYAVTVAKGNAKITGKAKSASFNAAIWNQVFFNAPASAGQTVAQIGEVYACSGAGSTKLANSATFARILSCNWLDTGLPLTQVTYGGTMPNGSFAIAANGNIQFGPDATGRSVVFDYLYSVTTGSTLTIANQLTGSAPAFQLVSAFAYEGKPAVVQFNAVRAPKLTYTTKNEDFSVPEFDFAMSADAGGVVGLISLPE